MTPKKAFTYTSQIHDQVLVKIIASPSVEKRINNTLWFVEPR
ncbi:MAG: hypothetical protein ABSE95_19020 [Thermodesulfobacteriota bacterium]